MDKQETSRRINIPLRIKHLVPYWGVKDYCSRAGFYSPNEERDITGKTALNCLGLAVYNGAIFGTAFWAVAERISGLIKLLE